MLFAAGLLLNLSAPHPLPLSLSLAPTVTRPLRVTASRLGQALVALLAGLALFTGLWSFVRVEELQSHRGNPRFIVAESRIRRGRIYDRNAQVIADIVMDAQGFVTRVYSQPEAAPVVGFATIAYGTDGIEAACDARLRGEVDLSPWSSARHKLLHIDPVGRDVRLTLDSRLQQHAQRSLAPHTGAAIVVDTRTGEILALASSPVYDSASVAAMWPTLSSAENSPFLNRATQALAQPGTSLQPFILASALQRDPSLKPQGAISATVDLNGLVFGCLVPPVDDGWSAALAAACPAPFVAAARRMGDADVMEALALWGFLDAPSLVLPTVAADLGGQQLDARIDALGQGRLLITPLQLAQAMATLGNDGLRPNLSLLRAPFDGCATLPLDTATRVVDADIADSVRHLLTPYAGAVGHLGTSLAGLNRQQAWFVGLNSADLPRYAVAVFLDQTTDPQLALSIGVETLRFLTEIQQIVP
jgi:peptidoglycan glycosyltransferase